jgi:trehalose 6-phosphate phosphatase
MRPLLSLAGRQALHALSGSRTLYAFDFDGTLAPIVPVPQDARLPARTASALERLCARVPVAIVTGRSVDDMTRRLPCEPAYLLGNHGGEGLPGGDAARRPALEAIVAGWVAALNAALPDAGPSSGVLVEDKGLSVSLHYRLAPDRQAALRAIEEAVARLAPPARTIGGKCVLNLLPPGAPDKGEAVAALARTEGADRVLYVGDDATDERVFETAPADWLTVRVGLASDSAARWFVHTPAEVGILLQWLAADVPGAEPRQNRGFRRGDSNG